MADDDDIIRGSLPIPSHPEAPRTRTEVDNEAARLKALGWTPEDIAEHLNITPRAAINAIKRGLAVIYRLAGSEQRILELISYDELESACWRQLEEGSVLVQHGKVIRDDSGTPLPDKRFTLEVFDRILKIKGDRRKLMGLDAPVRAEVITIDSVSAEIEKLEAEISQAQRELEAAEEDRA